MYAQKWTKNLTIKYNFFSFRAAVAQHYAKSHGSLLSLLAQVIADKGALEKLKETGIDQIANGTTATCQICNQTFLEKFLPTHQILKHFLSEYSNEIRVLGYKATDQKLGKCPVSFCKVNISMFWLNHSLTHINYSFRLLINRR